MTISIDATANTAIMTAVLALIEAGEGAGLVKFYNGTRPAPGTSVTGNTLICTASFTRPCGTIDAAGVLYLDPSPTLGSVLASLMPNWARVSDSAGNFVLDCAVRSSSGPDLGEEIVVDAATLSVGALLVIVSGYFTAA